MSITLICKADEQRKTKVINQLRSRSSSKLRLPSPYAGTELTNRRFRMGNRNAERQTRKIEMGWMDYQNHTFKQVTRPTGGGTR